MDDAFDEVRQMSEPAFRSQLLAWMQTKEVSQRIQSKLRRDMIECFTATTLGREIDMRQQQFGNRQVPTASILALNTLVAEFLYAQNCQFTLSVFASEVPYQGIIPDFETGPINHRFRFSKPEQQNLLHSLGVEGHTEETIEKQYRESTLNSSNDSLLFQLLCTIFPKQKRQTPPQTFCSKSTQCSVKQHSKKHSRGHSKSRSKYLNRIRSLIDHLTKSILDITDALSDHPLETSLETVARIIPELREQRHRIGRLKSRVDNPKLNLVAESIYQLSSELERCFGVLKIGYLPRKPNESCLDGNAEKAPVGEQLASGDHDIRYGDWVADLKNSVNGKRFLQHLIEHTRRVRQKFVDAQRVEMSEEIKVERARLKLHYKQRFLDRCQGLVMVSSGPVVEDNHPDSNVMRPMDASTVLEKVKSSRIVGLSNRKLPKIEISSEVDPNAEMADLKDKSMDSSNNVAQKTRQRVEQLVAQSDDIEQSIQKRLEQHSMNTKTIVEQQLHIKQQSQLGKQLIKGVMPTARITTRVKPVPNIPSVGEELDDPSMSNDLLLDGS